MFFTYTRGHKYRRSTTIAEKILLEEYRIWLTITVIGNNNMSFRFTIHCDRFWKFVDYRHVRKKRIPDEKREKNGIWKGNKCFYVRFSVHVYRDSVIYQPKTLFKYSDHIIAIFVSKTYSIHLMANRIGGINARACVRRWCVVYRDRAYWTVAKHKRNL